MAGYYKMARGWMDHPVFHSSDECLAWCWLIEHAAWRSETQKTDRRSVRVQRGEVAYSIRHLSVVWGWHRSKVERFLIRLKTETMIETLAETRYSILTVCNYDKYQTDDKESETLTETVAETEPRHYRDTSSSKPLNEQAENTPKKLKKLKKVERKQESCPSPNGEWATDFDNWWKSYPHKVGKGQAEKAYKVARKKAEVSDLLAGVERYRDQKPDDVKWCYPATWLNGERWLDEPAETGESGAQWLERWKRKQSEREH